MLNDPNRTLSGGTEPATVVGFVHLMDPLKFVDRTLPQSEKNKICPVLHKLKSRTDDQTVLECSHIDKNKQTPTQRNEERRRSAILEIPRIFIV